MIANLKQWVTMAFGIVCLVAGIATIWLPIPTGVPLLALGVFLVIANSRIGRNFVRRLRKHVDWLDQAILWLEDRAGRTVGRVLRTTRPLMTRHRKKAEQATMTETTQKTGSAAAPRSAPVDPSGTNTP